METSATPAAGVVAPPPAFLCPITRMLMEWPVVTRAGMTYEFSAISRWFEVKGTDPQTNARIADKDLVKNLLLRSQIQEWIEEHPIEAAAWRNPEAAAPPALPDADADAGDKKNEASLGKIIRFVGTTAKPNKAERGLRVPDPVQLQGRTYVFRRAEESGALEVRCEGLSGWVPMSAGTNALFLAPSGVILYDQREMHEVLVAHDDDSVPGAFATREPCPYKGQCTNRACTRDHPFPCRFGVSCRDIATCKFMHPDPESVVPLGEEYPLTVVCKYGTGCSNKTCYFAHPLGRVVAKRRAKELFMTHSHDLRQLDSPRRLDVGDAPRGATKFFFQGEFVFFFTPFNGTWAKDHFQMCTVHRFSPKTQTYQRVADYTLEGHYCNAAVGVGRYFVLSWWPYEEEAMRAIWEAVRRERMMEKTVKAKEAQILSLQRQAAGDSAALQQKDTALKGKDAALARQKGHIDTLQSQAAQQKGYIDTLQSQAAQQQGHIDTLQSQAAKASAALQRKDTALKGKDAALAQQKGKGKTMTAALKGKGKAMAEKDAYITTLQDERKAEREERKAERLAQRQQEQSWREQRRSDAIRRNERFRIRDPIHVYALQGGRTGDSPDDWVLVLDYHKGAHALGLSPAADESGVQRLHVTENNNVFEFDLLAPADLTGMGAGALPVVPGRLCDAF